MVYDGIRKEDIENRLKRQGDFMNMGYLSDLLKQNLPLEVKKFVALRLINIYEKKTMFTDVAKVYNILASLAFAFSEKIKFHIQEAESYIKADDFSRADEAMKKAFVDANASQRAEISFVIKDFYKRQAEVYEKEMRRAHAVRIYEKLFYTNISDEERKEIKEKLLGLYEKLGRFKEYHALKERV